MEKNRDLLEKISYTQGNISGKDGHNKGQKWYGPNRSRRYKEKEARKHRRNIQKKKKNLKDPDNHDGVITHLEPESWSLKSSGP